MGTIALLEIIKTICEKYQKLKKHPRCISGLEVLILLIFLNHKNLEKETDKMLELEKFQQIFKDLYI